MNHPETLWQRTLADIQLTLSAPVFNTWFARTKCVDIVDNQLTITCPNKITRDQLESRYRPVLQQTINQLAGEDIDLIFIIEDKPASADLNSPLFDQMPDAIEAVPTSPAQHTSSLQVVVAPASGNQNISTLNPHYTFTNFVVGNTNRVAHAAAQAVTDRPGQSYNPLFLYGGTGVGKTHLVQAIGNALYAKQPSIQILYCSSERFTNDFIDSLRFKTTNEFKKKYRSVDVLIVDDIQFIGGNKDSTQEEFFHTFNELHASGRQIILCSDRPPREIPSLADRLTSRFEGGLTVDISPPDFETRSAIIRTKAENLNLALSSEIADYVASLAPENIRALEGMMLKLQSLALTGQQLTLPVVQQLLGPAVTPTSPSRRPNPNDLLKLVCETYGITLKDLVGKKRTANLVVPRQLAMYLLRQDIGLNLESIGQLLGGRDHTTIMHGINKVTSLTSTDDQTRQAINAIRQVTLK